MHPILARKSTTLLIAVVAALLGIFVAYAGISGDIFATKLIRATGGATKQAVPKADPIKGAGGGICDFEKVTISFASFDASLIQEQQGSYGRTFSLGPLSNGSGCDLYGVTVTASIPSIGAIGSHSEGDIYVGASRGAFNLAVSIPPLTPFGSGSVNVSISGCTANTLGGSVACPTGNQFMQVIGSSPTVSWKPLPPTCIRQGCSSAQWLCYDPQTNGSATCSNYNIPGTGRTCVSCNPPPTVCNQPSQACQSGIAPNASNGLSCVSDTGVAAICQCTGGQRWDSAQGKCRTPVCTNVCSQLPTAGQEFRTQTPTTPPNAESAGPNCSGDYFSASCTDSYRWKCKAGHSFNTSAGRCECDNLNLKNPDGSCRPSPSVCGNGVKEAGEECDDHNLVTTDSCTYPTCRNARCGDGIVRAGVEQCDDGNTNNGDGCTNDCRSAFCGNGIVEGDEQCDDGNQANNDACNTSCRTQYGRCTAVNQCTYGTSNTGGTKACGTGADCCTGTNRPDGCGCSGNATNCASNFCSASGLCAQNGGSCSGSTNRPDYCGCTLDSQCKPTSHCSGPSGSPAYNCLPGQAPAPTAPPEQGLAICGTEVRPNPNPCFEGYTLACVNNTWLCQYQ